MIIGQNKGGKQAKVTPIPNNATSGKRTHEFPLQCLELKHEK